MTENDEIEIPSIAHDGAISADWLAMTLAEDARIENGRLENAPYLAVKIAAVSDEILARAVKAERERDEARAEVERLREALHSILPHPEMADQTLLGYGDFAIEKVANAETVRRARAALEGGE